MKTSHVLQIAMGLLTGGFILTADVVIPGISGTPVAGSDGVLNISAPTVIDLSEAPSGAWDSAPPVPGKGVYDPEKWAVVFKYASVTIGPGATVTFKNNASRAPVVWLVSGDVTINGTLVLDGSAQVNLAVAEPGPGGFRGGRGGSPLFQSGPGFGPGGGNRLPGGVGGHGAAHATAPGSNSGPAYGDADIRLLLGGSGGGGTLGAEDSGGAGGGAILIAAEGRIFVNGVVAAEGGPSIRGAGSGGSIRLVASEITGAGGVYVRGGQNLGGGDSTYFGSPGFIRLEALNFGTLATIPQAKVDVLEAASASIWPEIGAAQARIVSVSEIPVPTDPRAALSILPADVALPAATQHRITVETKNLPVSADVKIFATPLSGDRITLTATNVSGDSALATWAASLTNIIGRYALQVRAVAQ